MIKLFADAETKFKQNLAIRNEIVTILKAIWFVPYQKAF